MQIVSIPSNTVYTNLYTLSTFPAGTSLIVTNGASDTLFIVQAETIPTASSYAFPVLAGQSTLIHANEFPIWIRGGTGPVIVQTLLETIVPFTGVDLPHDLYTSDNETYRRFRVDVAQTGFFEGREFRTFKELSIASGATLVVRIVVPINTILQNVRLSLDAGSIKLRTVSGGTPTGTFAETLPIIPKNTMTGGVFPAPPTPLYLPQNVITSGATALTGGVDIDVIRIVVANASGQAQSVGAAVDDSRGVGPGTYYWVFNNFGTGTATGVFSSFWEERT